MICPECKCVVGPNVYECPECHTDLLPRYREMWKEYKNEPVVCPECGRTTRALKVYNLPGKMIYALVTVAGNRSVRRVGCQKCMRRMIWHQAVENMPTMHIAWPFAILPRTLMTLARTCVNSHSIEVVDRIDNERNGQ